MCDSNYWLDLEMGGNGLHHHCINDKDEVDLICKEQLEIKVEPIPLTLEQQIAVIVDERITQVLDMVNQSNNTHNTIHAMIESHIKNYYDRFKQQDRNNKNFLERLNGQEIVNREMIDKINVLNALFNQINSS